MQIWAALAMSKVDITQQIESRSRKRNLLKRGLKITMRCILLVQKLAKPMFCSQLMTECYVWLQGTKTCYKLE
ncbi:MAG: hypothetical protein ACYT04_07215 [Nostoc sp.]